MINRLKQITTIKLKSKTKMLLADNRRSTPQTVWQERFGWHVCACATTQKVEGRNGIVMEKMLYYGNSTTRHTGIFCQERRAQKKTTKIKIQQINKEILYHNNYVCCCCCCCICCCFRLYETLKQRRCSCHSLSYCRRRCCLFAITCRLILFY